MTKIIRREIDVDEMYEAFGYIINETWELRRSNKQGKEVAANAVQLALGMLYIAVSTINEVGLDNLTAQFQAAIEGTVDQF